MITQESTQDPRQMVDLGIGSGEVACDCSEYGRMQFLLPPETRAGWHPDVGRQVDLEGTAGQCPAQAGTKAISSKGQSHGFQQTEPPDPTPCSGGTSPAGGE